MSSIALCLVASGCTGDDPAKCTPPDNGAVTLEAGSASLPVGGDLIVRGSVTEPAASTLEKILVAGVPANHDGPDFATFDVTVPFAVIQSVAGAGRTSATLDVEAISSCGTEPTTVGTLTVTVRAVTTLMLTVTAPMAGYIPATKSVPAELVLTANAEAAGTPYTASTSQGTLGGAAMASLLGDGAGSASATFTLVGDPSKEGVAEVVAQAGIATAVAKVPIAGPVTFSPGTGAIAANSSLSVSLVSPLPASTLVGAITGCTADAAPHLAATTNGTTIAGLTPLANDGMGHLLPIIVTADPSAASKATIAITCIDVYGQAGSATYTVTP